MGSSWNLSLKVLGQDGVAARQTVRQHGPQEAAQAELSSLLAAFISQEGVVGRSEGGQRDSSPDFLIKGCQKQQKNTLLLNGCFVAGWLLFAMLFVRYKVFLAAL
ncbi:unnamed protein product [Polarella glacialis]|uniref:Uncharacterized protein n=1 Tax=Polarella glacialis TaxID=89957 RepID=A0A813KIS1_POLGL|nr:unnamed protein product [Polarella glacialis]